MRNKGVGGISAFEPWPNARDEQRMVLHVREGSSVSGGPSGGFPDPRDSELTTRWRTWCEGKAWLGDASLEERFGCT
jgi:hypothetical protein